jgi:N-formylglutamate deformylase
VLGDRRAASCARALLEAPAALSTAAGFSLGRNAPFPGGNNTQTYGRPRRGIHALQIEIDRSLYMNEAHVERLGGFVEVVARIGQVVQGLADLGPTPVPMAAE